MLNACWLLYHGQGFKSIADRANELAIIQKSVMADDNLVLHKTRDNDQTELRVEGSYLALVNFVLSASALGIPPYIINAPRKSQVYLEQALSGTKLDTYYFDD